MLLNLANMLVYQLATLQSEALAEKSSCMYEQSLSFLRRSIMPTHLRPANHPVNGANGSKSDIVKPRPKRAKAIPVRRRPSAVDDPDLPPLVVKSGPKESRDAKRRAMLDDTEIYEDAANTLRDLLGADAVAIVKMDDYQLYFRRSDSLEPDQSATEESIENPLFAFLQGKPWPEAVEPIVHHVPAPGAPPVVVLGTSTSDPDSSFHFLRPGTEETLGQYLSTFLKTRRFWWDRQDQDSLCGRLMGCLPNESQTLLAHALIPFEGRARFATFVAWNRPPESFADSSTSSLPFIHILGGITNAAVSIRKMRAMEQSQISYSNLQAQYVS
jgi:hypothetical protein